MAGISLSSATSSAARDVRPGAGAGAAFISALSVNCFGGFGAGDHVLDRDDALLALLAAFDDDGGRVAAVGVFHLRVHAGRAEIHLGADAGVAELGDHRLVARGLVAIHDEDDDGADDLGGRELPVSFSALARRETPIEKPVAGTGSLRKRETRPS